MKTAVRAACVLAAVFFAGVSGAATTVVSTTWFGSASQALSACSAAYGQTCAVIADNGSYITYAYGVETNGGWDNDQYVFIGYYSNPCTAPEVVQEADGSCAGPPPTVEERQAVCLAKKDQDGPILRGNMDGFENDSYTDSDGCAVIPEGSVQCAIPWTEENQARVFEPPVCWINSTYDGSYVPSESDPGVPSPPTQLTAPAPTTATDDSRVSHSDAPPPVTTTTQNPDGSTTTTTTTTETSTVGDGTVVTPGTTRTRVVSQEGGVTTVTTTEKKTTVNPDGSVVTVTRTTKTQAAAPKVITELKPSNGKVSVTSTTQAGATQSGTTTQTTTTAPDGSTSTTTSREGGGGQGAEGVGFGAGDGEGDETQSGTCGLGTPESPPCKIDEEGTPEFDAAELPDPTQALQDHVATLEGLTGEEAGAVESTADIRGAIDGALPTSGDCGPMTLAFGPTSLEIDGASKFAFIRQALSWVFGLLAAYTVFSVIIR